jgi:hypothetical protein
VGDKQNWGKGRAAQQPGSTTSQRFVSAAGNLYEFQLHLFGKNIGEKRVMWQRLIKKRLTKRYTSATAVLTCASALLFGCVDGPAQAQGVQTVLHARGRVFPDVGRGAEAIERDPAGHYYVLAAPASVIWIYSAEGKRIGQIPGVQAVGEATIKYAVDFDRDATSGRIFVADRGANAVKIFTAEGALEASVPVNAPMSVVALANSEFAVVTLRSDHLVRVMNEHGKLLRSFGNISDAVSNPSQLTAPALSASEDSAAGYAAGYSTSAPPSYAMDIGKLYSGAPGDIYFAFTLLKDPKFRKYDRFGYAEYEADVSANALIPDISHDNSQVQLGMRVSGMAGPGEMFSFGTMYSLGSGAPGFAVNGGHGEGGRRGGGSAAPGGTGGAAPGSTAGSGGSANSGGGDNDATTGDASDFSGSLSANSGNIASHNSYSTNTPDFNALLGIGGPGGGFGAPGIFGPGAFPGFGGGFEHHMIGADAAGRAGAEGAVDAAGHGATGGAAGAGAAGGALGVHATGGPAAGGGANTPGAGHGEYGERFGRGYRQESLNSFAGVVKITEREPNTSVTPVIRALGVDRASQQVWAAIGDMLLRFDRDGNLLDTYRVATTQGAALQPVGILVEPDRILLVSDPAGIYEFARPDKVAAPGKQSGKAESASP